MPEIYAYMTNFTKGWLKYQNSYEDLTKADFYMNFRFYIAVDRYAARILDTHDSD